MQRNPMKFAAILALAGLLAGTAPLVHAAEAADSGYRIGPEDVLEISVWKEEGLQKEVLVRPDGGLSFPLVGEIQATGKTAEEIREEVTQRLQRFISGPVVSVSVRKIVNNKIYVMGKVNRPGEYLTGQFLNVLQVLSMAGGLTPYAAENKIKILRKEGGGERVYPFEYGAIQRGEKLEQNITLRPGDVVLVP